MPPEPSGARISYGPRRVPAATLTSSAPPAGSDSFRNPHPPQQVVVARVVPNAVEARIHFHISQPGRMIVVCLFEPLKRGSRGAKADIDNRDVKWRHVVLCRLLLQRHESLLRLASPS